MNYDKTRQATPQSSDLGKGTECIKLTVFQAFEAPARPLYRHFSSLLLLI